MVIPSVFIRVGWVLLALCCVVSSGCAGKTAVAEPGVEIRKGLPRTVDISGRWKVTTGGGDKREMTLVQEGGRFWGTVSDGPVTGTIKGDQLEIALGDSGTRGTGTVSKDRITGSYDTTEEGRSGSWEAERIP